MLIDIIHSLVLDPKCHSTSAFPNSNADSAEMVIGHTHFLLTSSSMTTENLDGTPLPFFGS